MLTTNSTSSREESDSSPILRALNRIPTFNTNTHTLTRQSLDESDESLEVDLEEFEETDSSNEDALPSD